MAARSPEATANLMRVLRSLRPERLVELAAAQALHIDELQQERQALRDEAGGLRRDLWSRRVQLGHLLLEMNRPITDLAIAKALERDLTDARRTRAGG